VSLASLSFAKEERELLRDGALNSAESVLATGGSTLPTGSSPRASPPQPALQWRRSQLPAASNNRAAPIRSFLAERNNWPHWPLDLAISPATAGSLVWVAGFPLGVSVSTTEPKASPPAGGESRPKGSKTSKLTVHEERTVELIAPPQGGRFKGYTDYVVQDLVIRAHIVNFRCERWQTADGEMMTAPERLNCSPEAARALVKRMRLPRQRATDGKVLVSVDLSEINHEPMPARSPAGDPRSLKAQLAGVVEHEPATAAPASLAARAVLTNHRRRYRACGVCGFSYA
jgi:hypothetical protein